MSVDVSVCMSMGECMCVWFSVRDGMREGGERGGETHTHTPSPTSASTPTPTERARERARESESESERDREGQRGTERDREGQRGQPGVAEIRVAAVVGVTVIEALHTDSYASYTHTVTHTVINIDIANRQREGGVGEREREN